MSYSDGYYEIRESWRDWRIEARELLAYAQPGLGRRVLEIGCGGGGLLRLIEESGACAVGVDTLVSALELAREKTGGKVILIDENSSLPFPDNTFDAVIGQHVVEHLTRAAAALVDLARVLKPGGSLALATPNAHYPDPAHFSDSDHAHVFSPDELCASVERAGFVVESCSSIFPYLSPFRILRAVGVVGYRVLASVPYFSKHGRTILLAARKPNTAGKQ